MDCNACATLCETSPEFTTNGVTEKICTSLGNDTGLNPDLEVLHTNCEDFEVMNDCLIGRMDKEMDSYPDCGWKKFMHKFIPNIYEYLKALNCSLCGLWARAKCAYDSLSNLIDALNNSVGAQSFVRYFRDNSGIGAGYEWNLVTGGDHTLDIYMDANQDNPGSKVADRDYVVICTNCVDIHKFKKAGIYVTYYSSGDTRGMDVIRKRQSMHPNVQMPSQTEVYSWNVTTAVVIRKGEHIKLNANVWEAEGSGSYFRLHQVTMTWIPISPVDGFQLDDIMAC